MSQTATANDENLSENLYLTYSNNQLTDPSLTSLNMNRSTTKTFGRDDNNNNASKRVLLGKSSRPIFGTNFQDFEGAVRLSVRSPYSFFADRPDSTPSTLASARSIDS